MQGHPHGHELTAWRPGPGGAAEQSLQGAIKAPWETQPVMCWKIQGFSSSLEKGLHAKIKGFWENYIDGIRGYFSIFFLLLSELDAIILFAYLNLFLVLMAF